MNKIVKFAESVAYDVRSWAEDKAYDRGDRHYDLCGWCAIASAELNRRLSRHEISSLIQVAETDEYSHAFLLVDDHIIDVTATQFGDFPNQQVVVMHHREAEMYEYYFPRYSFDSAKQLRKWQIANGWPSNQVAFSS